MNKKQITKIIQKVQRMQKKYQTDTDDIIKLLRQEKKQAPEATESLVSVPKAELVSIKEKEFITALKLNLKGQTLNKKVVEELKNFVSYAGRIKKKV
jgi:hypothetical protein